MDIFINSSQSNRVKPLTSLGFILIFFCTNVATAGLDLEPYIGYEFGEWSTKNTTASDSGDSVGPAEGLGYGVKLLYGGKNLFLGLDYYTSTVAWNYSDDPDYAPDDDWADTEATKTSIGYFLGFRSSSIVLWYGMSYQDELKLKANTIPGKGIPVWTGSYTAFGLGYKAKTFKYSFEYRQHKYSEVTVGGSKGSVPFTTDSVTYNELTHSYYLLSISFPINIMGGSKGGGSTPDIPGA